MKVILDHNLSPSLAYALAALFKGEHDIVALRQKFKPSTPDKEWLAELSHDGRWVIISGDRRITRNKSEYEAFRNSRLIGFFLSKSLYKSKVTKQMERILVLWDKIEMLHNSVEGGAMFELPIKSNFPRQLRL